MTYKEALEAYHAKIESEFESGLPGSNELQMKIMQALVKQIPEKPTGGRCAACGRELRCPIKPYTALSGRKISRNGDSFCPRCGQAVSWECVHSVPKRVNGQYVRGCEWSIKRLPVLGWEAETKILRVTATDDCISYNVKRCPKFEKGR